MKNNTTEVDLLIVGQGLAGSAVAMRALARGYRILVVDEPQKNHSSRVAAGLFNPVTGRKMSKTWLADDLFPCLHQYYRDVETLTGRRFFFSMPIYRAFSSAEEQNEWMGRSGERGYEDFVSAVQTGPAFGDQVNDVFGGITLRQSGFLDTRNYLESVRDYLIARSSYLEATFQPEELVIAGAGSVKYSGTGDKDAGISARRVIFCQGIDNGSNPWFGHLPVRPLKGEFLTVQCQWQNDVILNRGVYVVPGSKPGEWRVGATFNREDRQPEITPRARQDLSRKLGDLIRTPYTVTGQQWGFRPTTPDRRPMLGVHPEHQALMIFNGLGTKGVSLAPYFSEVLIRWMESKGTLGKDADVSRFN